MYPDLFNRFAVEGETKGEDFTTAKIKLSADMDSIHTNNEQRDAHLRNADFFETEQHPKMVFESSSVEKIDGENFRLNGNPYIEKCESSGNPERGIWWSY